MGRARKDCGFLGKPVRAYTGTRRGANVITNSLCGSTGRALTKWIVAAGVLLLLSRAPAIAGDWPQFRGPERDAKSTDTKLLKKWPEGGPKLLWTKTGLGAGYTQAIVAGGTIYVTGSIDTEGYVHAFDLDGTPRWR